MSVVIFLDNLPPANPSLAIAGGVARTAVQDVAVTLTSPDVDGGAADVTEMKLWGDVDLAADPDVQATEATSVWKPYTSPTPVRLSAGAGRKYVRAKLRDDVGNETLEFSDFIDFDPTTPYVEITSAPSRSRVSLIVPFDTTVLSWQGSVPFDHYEVRVVPSEGSPHTDGVVIPTVGGSSGVLADGTFLALVPITTTIKGADLAAASPGSTAKIVKVFIRSGTTWSV